MMVGWRVEESGSGDRIDRVMGRVSELGRKTRRKSFSAAAVGGGGGGGARRKREREEDVVGVRAKTQLNEGEAEISISHAKRLIQSGVRASDIGIITPYSLYVVSPRMLRTKEDKLKELEISTVDGFQGRENEAIIISMVYISLEINVIAPGDCDKFLKRLIEYFEENGEYLSGSEYGSE
ncbi:DNA-binding protein SMUBP-2 [Tanacetum coccineum]